MKNEKQISEKNPERGKKLGVQIFINDEPYKAPKPIMSGAELKALGNIPPGNKLYKEIPGTHPDEPIGDEQQVELKNGDKFYDLPPGKVGEQDIHQNVREQIEKAKNHYPGLIYEFEPTGAIHLEVPEVALPPGWNSGKTRILIILPEGYPTNKPNGFEADANLRLAGGGMPAGGSKKEIENKSWIHFCWNPERWYSSLEALWKFIKFAESRFREIK